MKYTISEFAEEIRALYPGDYDDLTDGKLVELWLKKHPKDIDKVDLSRKETIDLAILIKCGIFLFSFLKLF